MKVRDKLWLFASCAHDDDPSLGKGPNHDRYLKKSRITPAEGCFMLDIPNIIMVGSSGGFRSGNEEAFICELAEKYPNVVGAFADDLFFNDDMATAADDEVRAAINAKKEKNKTILESVTTTLAKACRPMELWATLYISNLETEVWKSNPAFWEHFTGLSLWTWEYKDLPKLKENFEKVKECFPRKKLYLGVYIYDYTSGEPVPDDMMELQCEFGLEKLKAGEIEGIIFLTNCTMGIGLPSEYWLRTWIDKVKNTKL